MKTPKEEDINHVLAGESTPETAREVAAWFATAEGSSYLESHIMANFEDPVIANDAEISGENIPSEKILREIQGKITRRRLLRHIGKVAAIVFPFILLISSFVFMNTRINLFGAIAYEEIYVPKGENMQIIFQDGSKVYLDSDTRLKYPKKFAFGKREVYLDGQGYFEVNSNKNWPFIVNLSGPSIKVLGTSFNVNAYSADDEITVRLDEGKIRMNTYLDFTYNLSQGDLLTYDRKTKKCSIVSNSNTIINKENYAKKEILFVNASLDQVIKTLNRKYNIEFNKYDKNFDDIKFSIEFKNDSIEEVISELEKISTIRFEYNRILNQINIKKK